MKSKLGLAYMFEQKIILNEEYFSQYPQLLPYTLFHEMTHLWLYSCLLDPSHTKRFYNKMKEFEGTRLPIDSQVHIHSRVVAESSCIYCCPNCDNRWYLKEIVSYTIYCGHCFDKYGVEHFAEAVNRNLIGANKAEILVEKYKDRILSRLPEAHQVAILAAYIASYIVYREGLGWLDGIPPSDRFEATKTYMTSGKEIPSGFF